MVLTTNDQTDHLPAVSTGIRWISLRGSDWKLSGNTETHHIWWLMIFDDPHSNCSFWGLQYIPFSDRGIYTGPNLTKAVIFTGKKWALRGAFHKNHVLIIGPLKHIYINIIYWNCNHLESDCEFTGGYLLYSGFPRIINFCHHGLTFSAGKLCGTSFRWGEWRKLCRLADLFEVFYRGFHGIQWGLNGVSMVFQWDSTGFDGEYIWIELDVYYDLIGEMVIWSCH